MHWYKLVITVLISLEWYCTYAVRSWHLIFLKVIYRCIFYWFRSCLRSTVALCGQPHLPITISIFLNNLPLWLVCLLQAGRINRFLFIPTVNLLQILGGPCTNKDIMHLVTALFTLFLFTSFLDASYLWSNQCFSRCSFSFTGRQILVTPSNSQPYFNTDFQRCVGTLIPDLALYLHQLPWHLPHLTLTIPHEAVSFSQSLCVLPLPLSQHVLQFYVTWLARTLSYQTIKVYLAGATKIYYLLCGILQVQGSSRHHPHRPAITMQHLQQLLWFISSSGLHHHDQKMLCSTVVSFTLLRIYLTFSFYIYYKFHIAVLRCFHFQTIVP